MAAPSENFVSIISDSDKCVLNRIFNPNLPNLDVEDEDTPCADEPIVLNETELRAKGLEECGVRTAESGDLDGALETLDQAVTTAPHRASGYNNRAQIHRLRGDDQAALCDLDLAISLSQGQGRVASQAYTQRALLRKKQGDVAGSTSDLQTAARLGNKFARTLVLADNPYSAMCNQMLSEVMVRLRAGEPVQ